MATGSYLTPNYSRSQTQRHMTDSPFCCELYVATGIRVSRSAIVLRLLQREGRIAENLLFASRSLQHKESVQMTLCLGPDSSEAPCFLTCELRFSLDINSRYICKWRESV
ncbi:hypothetical protein TNCV_946981 [Trichonephila clavipes]|nr:hypothetical protein TNCV_946981 [Trichonephila clavipes]